MWQKRSAKKRRNARSISKTFERTFDSFIETRRIASRPSYPIVHFQRLYACTNMAYGPCLQPYVISFHRTIVGRCAHVCVTSFVRSSARFHSSAQLIEFNNNEVSLCSYASIYSYVLYFCLLFLLCIFVLI